MGDHTPSNPATAKTAIAFSRPIDWAIGAILSFAGTLIALSGTALYYGVTRPDITDYVHSSEFQSEVLTDGEAIDALIALGQWSGIGLLAAGGLLILIGTAVVVAHRRARLDDRSTPNWVLGVVGALIGSLLSFIPLSPILGGLAAGYLNRNPETSGLGTGTLAGVFGSLPLFVVIVVASIGLIVSVPNETATAVVTVVSISLFLILPYFVGLSAIGGYLGGWVRKF
ncbi:DUF5518 domain-containing protein [Halopenitus sp. H-Gu1]|uniref:DUF5518 domain-containing protein n=1 Tax=Halopenitus sp. H-Gu1 TaxID=3242697 RepID=UPI00359D186C